MVVTGAASGIGKAIAVMAGAQGAHVVVADMNDEGGQATVNEIVGAGGKADAPGVGGTEPTPTVVVDKDVGVGDLE